MTIPPPRRAPGEEVYYDNGIRILKFEDSIELRDSDNTDLYILHGKDEEIGDTVLVEVHEGNAGLGASILIPRIAFKELVKQLNKIDLN